MTSEIKLTSKEIDAIAAIKKFQEAGETKIGYSWISRALGVSCRSGLAICNSLQKKEIIIRNEAGNIRLK
jgi:Mn-dependent DtxR family transcriptional regulator